MNILLEKKAILLMQLLESYSAISENPYVDAKIIFHLVRATDTLQHIQKKHLV